MTDLLSCECGTNPTIRCIDKPKEDCGAVYLFCETCGDKIKPIEFYGRDRRKTAYSVAYKRWNRLKREKRLADTCD